MRRWFPFVFCDLVKFKIMKLLTKGRVEWETDLKAINAFGVESFKTESKK